MRNSKYASHFSRKPWICPFELWKFHSHHVRSQRYACHINILNGKLTTKFVIAVCDLHILRWKFNLCQSFLSQTTQLCLWNINVWYSACKMLTVCVSSRHCEGFVVYKNTNFLLQTLLKLDLILWKLRWENQSMRVISLTYQGVVLVNYEIFILNM